MRSAVASVRRDACWTSGRCESSVRSYSSTSGVPRKDWDLVSRRAEAQEQTQTWLVTSVVVEELHRRAREQRAGALRTVGALPDDQQAVLRPAVTAMEAAFSLMERNIEAVHTVWNRLFPGSATAS
jgi:hypothetical protein